MAQISRIREGKWTCSYCKATVGGSIRTCPNCGHPRSDGVKFDEDPNKKYLSEEQAKKINRNPDWICSYCNSLNSDSSTFCESCGASKTESEKNYFNSKKNQTTKNIEESNSTNKINTNDTFEKKLKNYSSNNNNQKNNPIKLIGYIFLTLFMLCFLVSLPRMIFNQEKKLEINNFGWEREVIINKHVPVTESDWYLPSGATLLSTNKEIHHYDKIETGTEIKSKTVSKMVEDGTEEYKVGTKDLGNGYFEDIYNTRKKYKTEYETETYSEKTYRNDPVYQTKYYYSIYRWVYSRTESSTENNKKPYWKEFTLADNEREINRKEKFYLLCTDLKKNKEMKYYIDNSLWTKLNNGDIINAKTSLSNITEIETNENGEIKYGTN